MDAGISYSVTPISAMIALASKFNGQFIVLDKITSIISIDFCMVIIHVGMASVKRHPGDTRISPVNQLHWRGSFVLPRLEVHIVHLTESH
ncbi:hypothetical protein BV25DRAFT_1995670 [Artomyces pyxidatus]|uniref:Uncharacterized protein n=1 Tax=Artomyces pyxidatus TaxID=48021 RepID=A0ACB8SIW0_9AGAM|nr:hypothetical protein BV25DRAFT_1995670 [Artomyces pyxidatus]